MTLATKTKYADIFKLHFWEPILNYASSCIISSYNFLLFIAITTKLKGGLKTFCALGVLTQ